MSAPAGIESTSLPDVLTVNEVAAYLRVHPATIYRALEEGRLPGRKIGTTWRILRAEFEQWLEAQRPKPRPRREVPDAGPMPRPRQRGSVRAEVVELVARRKR